MSYRIALETEIVASNNPEDVVAVGELDSGVGLLIHATHPMFGTPVRIAAHLNVGMNPMDELLKIATLLPEDTHVKYGIADGWIADDPISLAKPTLILSDDIEIFMRTHFHRGSAFRTVTPVGGVVTVDNNATFETVRFPYDVEIENEQERREALRQRRGLHYLPEQELTFGQLLTSFIAERDTTQTFVAEALGIDRKTVSSWCSGQYTPRDAEIPQRIGAALSLDDREVQRLSRQLFEPHNQYYSEILDNPFCEKNDYVRATRALLGLKGGQNTDTFGVTLARALNRTEADELKPFGSNTIKNWEAATSRKTPLPIVYVCLNILLPENDRIPSPQQSWEVAGRKHWQELGEKAWDHIVNQHLDMLKEASGNGDKAAYLRLARELLMTTAEQTVSNLAEILEIQTSPSVDMLYKWENPNSDIEAPDAVLAAACQLLERSYPKNVIPTPPLDKFIDRRDEMRDARTLRDFLSVSMKDQGMTRQTLADALGVHVKTVNRWMTPTPENFGPPSKQNMTDLATVLKLKGGQKSRLSTLIKHRLQDRDEARSQADVSDVRPTSTEIVSEKDKGQVRGSGR